MKKRICALLAAALCPLWLAGCGRMGAKQPETASPAPEMVELVVWGAQEDQELLEQLITGFESSHQGEAVFNIRFECPGRCRRLKPGGRS